MRNKRMVVLGAVSLASAVVLIGCAKNADSEGETAAGIGERTGAALDTAADKTADAAKATAAKTKEMTDKAVQKTGEALEKTGAGMQDDATTDK